LHCLFLDTGALYRAVAYAALARGISPDDERTVGDFARSADPSVELDASSPLGYRIRVDGRVLTDQLFTPPVSAAVSAIAANAAVRTSLIDAQRSFAAGRDVVMAGRDIGSVVLPDATWKFFLTASLDARVDRRFKELRDRGIDIERGTLRAEIQRRDERDRNRAASPLVKAQGAIEIDSSTMTIDEVVDELEALVRRAAP